MAGKIFGERILDLKVVAQLCEEAPQGLIRMCKNLEVKVAGKVTLQQTRVHQAEEVVEVKLHQALGPPSATSPHS